MEKTLNILTLYENEDSNEAERLGEEVNRLGQELGCKINKNPTGEIDIVFLVICSSLLNAKDLPRKIRNYKQQGASIIAIISSDYNAFKDFNTTNKFHFIHHFPHTKSLQKWRLENKTEHAWRNIQKGIKFAFEECTKRIEQEKRKTKIFISWSEHEDDKSLTNKLKTQLKSIENVDIWSRQDLLVGDTTDENTVCDKKLRDANIILLLLSPEFLVCEKCKTVIDTSLGRREEENINVVPILLRSANWKGNKKLAGLTILPRDEKAINSQREDEVDDKLAAVTTEIQLLCKTRGENHDRDLFKEMFDDSTKEKRNILLPRFSMGNLSFVEPSFLNCMRLSLNEVSHVIFVHGARGSGRSKILETLEQETKRESPEKTWMSFSASETQSTSISQQIIDVIAGILDNENSPTPIILSIDNFELFDQQEEILEKARIIMEQCRSKVVLIIAGMLKPRANLSASEPESPLSRLLDDRELQGLYDYYQIDFSTYGSRQTFKVISELNHRFKYRNLAHNIIETIPRYASNNIHVAISLYYEILKALYYAGSDMPSENSYLEKVLDNLQSEDKTTINTLSTFENAKVSFTRHSQYSNLFNEILEELSRTNSRGYINLRRMLTNNEAFRTLVSNTKDSKTNELDWICTQVRTQIGIISSEYGYDLFNYEKGVICVCNIEFLFYLKVTYSSLK